MPIGYLMIDLDGVELSQEEKELLNHPDVGGVVLFTRNYHSIPQLEKLIFDIRNASSSPLLISVDHEGGRVQRFHENFTALPCQARYGELYNSNPEKALKMAVKGGWLMAIELLTMGIDFSFAPVLDLKTEQSKIIGERAFHESPYVVVQLAKSYIAGMNEAGMQSVGKHFPGHGTVIEDSHTEVPIDRRDWRKIFENDLVPFLELAKFELAGIMPAHIIFSEVDTLPVTYSTYWLKDALREGAGYKGAIISDDLSMSGAAVFDSYVERAQAAVAAGCDMILVCNQRDAVINILDGFQHRRDSFSEQRLLKLSGRFQFMRHELMQTQKWHEISAEIKAI